MKCKQKFPSAAFVCCKVAGVLPMCKTEVDQMSIVKFG